MKLIVNEVNQRAGGGSYVVVYEADVALLDEPSFKVTIDRVEPPGIASDLIEIARSAILRGARRAVVSHKGIELHVSRLLINEVDFKEGRFELFTTIHLRALLGEHP